MSGEGCPGLLLPSPQEKEWIWVLSALPAPFCSSCTIGPEDNSLLAGKAVGKWSLTQLEFQTLPKHSLLHPALPSIEPQPEQVQESLSWELLVD